MPRVGAYNHTLPRRVPVPGLPVPDGTTPISLKCKVRAIRNWFASSVPQYGYSNYERTTSKPRVTTSSMNTRGNYRSYGSKMTARFPRGLVILAGSSCRPLAEEVAR